MKKAIMLVGLLLGMVHTVLAEECGVFMVHPTFRVMRQSCSAYSLNSKYRSSLNPYAVLFMTFILLC